MQVQIGDNILLVGTAHVSKTSVEEVRAAIRDFQPEAVAVELDELRHKAVTEKRDWEETPVTKLIKGNKLYFFLAQTLLAAYQRRMGEEQGVEPGAEMVEAIKAAKDAGAEVALADRDIGVTFRRAFAIMGFRERMRIIWELMKALIGLDPAEEHGSVDELLDQDLITTMMEELGEFAPSIKSVVIDERDLYLATRIREASENGTKKVVGVVGAGHLKGIQRQLEDPQPVALDLLEDIPKGGFPWGKLIGYGVPLIVLGLFGFLGYRGYVSGDYTDLLQGFWAWILWNGGLSALGAALGGGHIISIITAFLAAPLTSLNPALAAGWFSGAAEATVRKPRVKDFEGLATIATFREMYKNQVMRVLLVAAFANIGSVFGTYIGGAELLRLVF